MTFFSASLIWPEKPKTLKATAHQNTLILIHTQVIANVWYFFSGIQKKAELDQNIHALFQYNQSMLWGGQAPKSWKEKHHKKRPSLTVWCSWIFCFKKVMQVWNDMRETKWGHFWFAFNMPDYNAIVRVMCYENAWETHLTPSSFWHLEVELLPEESQCFLSERISQNWSKTAHISAQSQKKLW